MRQEFRKGEWKTVLSLSGDLGVRTPDGYICFLPLPMHYEGQDDRFAEEMTEYKANANLIQASPVMYEALDNIANFKWEPLEGMTSAMMVTHFTNIAKAALAKLTLPQTGL